MDPALIQVVSTLASEAEALELGRKLVEERLAACAQVSGPITSIYSWKGKLQQETEWKLTLKSRQSLYGQIERRLAQLHPFDEPQILALPLVEASLGYRNWLLSLTADLETK
ncbi:MAG: divalent-cation tolerance protein CutA [bacterium]|nr:divalent-cation tolerance protein CutA [bacterium]